MNVLNQCRPKPTNYLKYKLTGECPQFNDMCALGFTNSLCQYIDEYVQWAPEWHTAQALHDICNKFEGGPVQHQREAAQEQGVQEQAAQERAVLRAAVQQAVSRAKQAGLGDGQLHP